MGGELIAALQLGPEVRRSTEKKNELLWALVKHKNNNNRGWQLHV